MKKIYFVAIAAASLFLSGCAAPAGKVTFLIPMGESMRALPAVVIAIDKSLPIAKKIKANYLLTAVDGHKIDNLEDATEYFGGFSTKKPLKEIVFKSAKDENEIKPDIAGLYNKSKKYSAINFFENRKKYVVSKNISKAKADGVFIKNSGVELTGVMSVIQIPHYSPYLMFEVLVYAENPSTIRSITIRKSMNKGAIFKSANLDQFFQEMYPVSAPAGQRVAVPAPTVSGYTGYTSSYGNMNTYSSGNYRYGTYLGNSYTTVTPTYDHSAQLAASMHNLGVAIQEANIEAQNNARSGLENLVVNRPLPVGEIPARTGVYGMGLFYVPYGINIASSFLAVVNVNGQSLELEFAGLN